MEEEVGEDGRRSGGKGKRRRVREIGKRGRGGWKREWGKGKSSRGIGEVGRRGRGRWKKLWGKG